MLFSMLTSLTSGIKLNHLKGPNNLFFVSNYSYMVGQFVLEALKDVSRDSELIKYEQKTTFFFHFFKFIQSTPTDFFQEWSVSRKAMEQ